MTNTKPHFSRKLLAIPYGLFLALFVVVPLLIIIYYAFTNGKGEFTLENFREFFSGDGNGIADFPGSSTAKTIGRSLLISTVSTLVCLFIAYPVAYIIANCNLKNKSVLLLLFVVPMWVNFVLRSMRLKNFSSGSASITRRNGLFSIPSSDMVYDFLPFMILPIYTGPLSRSTRAIWKPRGTSAPRRGKPFLKLRCLCQKRESQAAFPWYSFRP